MQVFTKKSYQLLQILISDIYLKTASTNIQLFIINLWSNFLIKITFISIFYIRNEYIWQDGFLFDFLQKKTADAWIRRFVIYTGFLFSERLVFDSIIRLYIDNLIWNFHYFSIFEVNNVSEMLISILYLYVTVLLFLLFWILL